MTTFELQKLDEEIARIPASPKTDEDFDRRVTLMARRIELEQTIRAAAANSHPRPRGNLVVFVPEGSGISHFTAPGGAYAKRELRKTVASSWISSWPNSKIC